MNLILKTFKGETVNLTLQKEDVEQWTVLDLKNRVSTVTQLPANGLRLVSSTGKVLAPDDSSLTSFDTLFQTTDEIVIHVVKVNTTPAAASTISPTALRSVPTTPLGLPPGMEHMMNNPMVASMLESPDFMNMMIENNPQLRNLVANNPEARQMLTSPSTLRQMSEIMRNPSMMQEMLRNHDRQLSNIEAIPGGFHALSSMYHSMNEPEQADEERPRTNLANTPNSPTQREINTQALPNPWARPTSNSNPSQSIPASQQSPGMNPSLFSLFQGMGNQQPGAASTQAPRPAFPFPFPPPMTTQSTAPSQNAAYPQMPFFPFMPMTTQSTAPSQNAAYPQMPFFPFMPTAGLPFANNPPTPSAPTEAPEIRFRNQLKELEEMGFTEKDKNIRALLASAGDVPGAVDYLVRM